MTALSVNLNRSVEQIIKNSGINDNTALFAANQARKLMSDYVPMKTGALCDTAQVFTENGRAVVLYVQPYAKFCYYGEKQKFSRDRHEKASAYWDKAMTLANKGVLTARVNGFVKRGKK